MSDDECSLFSYVWGPSPAEKKEGESKSQSNPVINHVIYHWSASQRHCANCGIKGKGVLVPDVRLCGIESRMPKGTLENSS